MIKSSLYFSALIYFISTSLPVLSHHSSAAFDTSRTTELKGTITEYSFRNPHVYMTLVLNNAEGSTREVEIEAGAGSVIAPLGFTRDAVAVGDVVTIVGNPGRRNPDSLVLGRELYKEDGSYYPLNISSKSNYEPGNSAASSLEGTWFSPRTEFFSFLGTASSWSLTQAGRSAADSAGPTDTTHKDCIPIGVPGLLFYPVANTITVENDKVMLSIDWLESERVIYLDGRSHPSASETFLHGHSTGRWEGGVLIVDSTNFSQHDMGLSMSVPGSTQKHLTERFELVNDGKALHYSGLIQDPVYLEAPVSFSGELQYRPQMTHSNEVCDIETARRFLDDY